ncbi:amidohydrolase [Flavobacteriaceae bacterium]|nr:amidohydrolase [Flavobacteriaceae bacterium]
MKKLYKILLLTLILTSCHSKNEVDLIIHNANIYTVDSEFSSAQALAVKGGKIVAIGNDQEILNNYKSAEINNLNQQTVVPGLIDAHAHFHRLGSMASKVRLEGTKSYQEVLDRIVNYQKENQVNFITGRGWDQNDWESKTFPNKKELDKLFPETPVAVTRVDGHALLVNQAALDLAQINGATKIEGGEIIKDKNGKPTGVLIDAAMQAVYDQVPPPTTSQEISSLKKAEEICLSYGLTTVDDAGLPRTTIELIDSLQHVGALQIRIYAMVSASDENLDYYLAKGISKTDRLNVRSFKFYGDGALGSRGATLREPYTDRHAHYGALINSVARFENTAKRIAASEFQMNTHAIGDSTNHLVLHTYKEVLEGQKDRRWRIEHAQIVSPEDFNYFEEIIPSIQPTHATSDMYWAEDRVGSKRMETAYAYKDLLKVHGKVALGTDFPVENVNPFYTFYAASVRQDLQAYPENGFQMENALSREETLKGMTIWAAYSNFEENEKGSLEPGKMADFTVLDRDIMKVDNSQLPNTQALKTYISGKLVYNKNPKQ